MNRWDITGERKMKKMGFAMILMAGICITTISCTREKTLKGTTWDAVQTYSSYTASLTLSFYESTFTLDERDTDGDYYSTTGTYTYNAPVVTLFVEGEGNVSGTVTGNTLLLDGIAFTRR